MAKCNRCGVRFDKELAEETFCIEFPLHDYNNFTIPLCADCAIEVIEDLEEGYYYETCECCGKKFDPVIEESKFEFVDDGTNLISWWREFGIVCCDCAENKIAEYFREHEAELEIDDMFDLYDDDDEDDSGERLSVYDAALIWMSNGKDEDYMFGYTTEELEDAL